MPLLFLGPSLVGSRASLLSLLLLPPLSGVDSLSCYLDELLRAPSGLCERTLTNNCFIIFIFLNFTLLCCVMLCYINHIISYCIVSYYLLYLGLEDASPLSLACSRAVPVLHSSPSLLLSSVDVFF